GLARARLPGGKAALDRSRSGNPGERRRQAEGPMDALLGQARAWARSATRLELDRDAAPLAIAQQREFDGLADAEIVQSRKKVAEAGDRLSVQRHYDVPEHHAASRARHGDEAGPVRSRSRVEPHDEHPVDVGVQLE